MPNQAKKHKKNAIQLMWKARMGTLFQLKSFIFCALFKLHFFLVEIQSSETAFSKYDPDPLCNRYAMAGNVGLGVDRTNNLHRL